MVPYTYLVKHKPTGCVYYGVRYSKNCHPDDFFAKYFTSSKRVKSLIKRDGLESFQWEIRQTFNNPQAAKDWEYKVLTRMKIWDALDVWLNRAVGNKFLTTEHTPESRAKMSKARKGVSKSPEHRAKIAAGNMNKVMSEEARTKMRGPRPAMRGRKLTKDHKAKIGLGNTGIKRPDVHERFACKARTEALNNGSKTYIGTKPHKCGSWVRYVSSNGCVACSYKKVN